MSSPLVLEYSPEVGSPWANIAVRWFGIIFILIFAAALGAGIAYFAEPRIYQATGLLRYDLGDGEPLPDHRQEWKDQVQSAVFRSRLDELLRAAATASVAHHGISIHEQTENLSGIRIGSESIAQIPDPRLLIVTAESTDPPSAAKAVQLIGDAALNEGNFGNFHEAVWAATSKIPTGSLHHTSYPLGGGLFGAGSAVFILWAASRKRSAR